MFAPHHRLLLCSKQLRAGIGGARLKAGAVVQQRTARPQRGGAVSPRSMVNVDVSPSVILGVGLIGAGVSLWQIRQARPWISKDYDVVISCISLLVGGILIFQVGHSSLKHHLN